MEKSKTLILVRHGKTVRNEQGLMQGQSNIPLSENGVRECGLLAEELKNYKTDRIFSSPLRRAVQTAEIISKYHSLEIERIDDLAEIDMGEWDGLSYADIKKSEKDFFERWYNDTSLAIPGGESFSDLCLRAEKAVKKIMSAEWDTCIVTGHSAINRAVLKVILNMNESSARRFLSRNSSYSELKIYSDESGHISGSSVQTWNVNKFLEGKND